MFGIHAPQIVKVMNITTTGSFSSLSYLTTLLKRTCESMDQSPGPLSHSANTLLARGPASLEEPVRVARGPALRGQTCLDCRVAGPVCAIFQLNARSIKVLTWLYRLGHLSVAKPSRTLKDTQLSHSVHHISTMIPRDGDTHPASLPSTAP